MTVNSLTPDLMVEDLAETVEWYESVFDAEVEARLPDGDDDSWWAQLAIGDASLMVQERDSLTEKISTLDGSAVGGSLALYLDVDDAERLRNNLADAGVEIAEDLHETDFGWEQFAIEDCNGYVLWFGEKLDGESSQDIGRRHRSLVRRHHG